MSIFWYNFPVVNDFMMHPSPTACMLKSIVDFPFELDNTNFYYLNPILNPFSRVSKKLEIIFQSLQAVTSIFHSTSPYKFFSRSILEMTDAAL